MSPETQRSAGYSQDYRPMSPTSQGLDRLRYCREYLGQQRLRQPMDLPRYTDNWTRYSGYLPPARPPRTPPWILQLYADQNRGRQIRRWVYGLHPPGQTPLRRARARQSAGQKSDIGRALADYEAPDKIESLATELSAMDAADASMYEVPAADWRHVDLVDMTNRLWYWMPSGRRPYYWQKLSHHEVMAIHELQDEANRRRLKMSHADRMYLLEVLKINSEAFVHQFRGLRHRNIRELQFLIMKHEVDIDTEYPYSREDLAFLIADRSARDAVDDYNTSLPVNTPSEQETQDNMQTTEETVDSVLVDNNDKKSSEDSIAVANISKNRAHTDEGPDLLHKKLKVSSTAAHNVGVGSDADSYTENAKKQASPVSSAPGTSREVECPEYPPDNTDEQLDRELSEGEVSEDESTPKRSRKNKVPKSFVKRFIIDRPR